MPSPGVPAPPRLPIEDSYFELLADTLEGLDLPVRGQFLQRYFRAIAHVDLRESQSVQIWDEMLSRRRELTGLLGRQVSHFGIRADPRGRSRGNKIGRAHV